MQNILLLFLLLAAPIAYFWWGISFETVMIISVSFIFIILVKLFQMELKQDEDLKKMKKDESVLPEIKDIPQEN